MASEEKEPRKPNELTAAQISEVLSKCYPGLSEPVLSVEEAEARGALIFDDMAEVRFSLAIGQSWPVNMPGYEAIHIPSYELPGISYGPEVDPDGTKGRDAAGPLISCGEFIRLSRACELGHTLLKGNQWPNQFASRLRNPDDHLVVIEEVLWLGRWRSPKFIKNSYHQNSGTNKDVDWRFMCCDMIINFEVKYRRRDWMGVTDGPHFSRDFDSYFDDVEGKFGPRPDTERNVLGISTMKEPDASLLKATHRFLESNPEIDAVVFWSFNDPEGKRPEVIGKDAKLIKMLLEKSTREENMFIAPIMHLWRKREERRAIRPDEALDALKNIHGPS